MCDVLLYFLAYDMSRFTLKDEIGYRDLNLNLEVGWTVDSESDESLEFVTVDGFDKKDIRTHICEVIVNVSFTSFNVPTKPSEVEGLTLN